MTKQYVDWNYDTGLAIEYNREGECNSCGDCCRSHIVIAENKHDTTLMLTPTEIKQGTKFVGDKITEEVSPILIQLTKIDSRHSHRMIKIGDMLEETTCPQLDSDNKCMVQNDKSGFCREWPMSPQHTKPFEKCSYTFIEVRRWTFNHEE